MSPSQIVFPSSSIGHSQIEKEERLETQRLFSLSKASGIGREPSTLSTLDYTTLSLRDGVHSHSPIHFIKFVFNDIWGAMSSCFAKLKSVFFSKKEKANLAEERIFTNTLENLKNLLANSNTPRESVLEAFRWFPPRERQLFLQNLMDSYVEQRCKRYRTDPSNPWDKPLFHHASQYIDRICQKKSDELLVFVPVVFPDRYDHPILRPHTTFFRVLDQMPASPHKEALLGRLDRKLIINTESLRAFAAIVSDFFAEEVEGREAFKEEFKQAMDFEVVRCDAESLATNCLKEESFIIGFLELRNGERIESSGDPQDPLSIKYLSDHLFDEEGFFRTVLEKVNFS